MGVGSGVVAGVGAGSGVGSGVGVTSGVVTSTGVGSDASTGGASGMVIGVEPVSSSIGIAEVLAAATLVGGGVTGMVDKTEGGTARVVGVTLIKVGGGGPMEVGVNVEKVDVSTD